MVNSEINAAGQYILKSAVRIEENITFIKWDVPRAQNKRE